MANLLDRSSLVLTPTAYNNGEALCIKPDDGSGDFQFSRNSAATRVNAQGLVENVQILSSNLVQNGSFSEEGVQQVSNGSFSQEGSEELANSDFTNGLTSWNGGIGNTVVNNQLIANSSGIFYQGLNLTANKTYKAEINIESISQGGVKFYCQGNQSATITTSGVHTIYIVSGSSNILVGINPQGTFEAVVNSISFSEVGQDWTLGTGWSIGENKAIATNATGNLLQTNVFTIGKTYKINFTINEVTSGNGVKVKCGSTNGTIRNTEGTYVEYLTCTGSAHLFIDPNISFSGSVTNISVKEVGQNWDIVGEAELTEQGGRIYSSSGSVSSFNQNNVMVIGNQYKLTFDVIATNGTKLSNASGTNIYDTSTIGSKVFYITADYTTLYLKRFGGITDVTITNISVIEISTDTNLPRINYEGFSYDGSGAIIPDSGCGSWLFEPASRNLITQSELFSDASWLRVGSITTTDNYTTSPSGQNNGTRLQWTNATNYIYQSLSHVGSDFTLSIYLKSNTDVSQQVRLFMDNGAQAKDVIVTTQWQRFELTNTTTPTQSNRNVGLIKAGGQVGDLDISIWGAQFEQQSYATSYIPNFGEANGVSRNQDLCTNGGSLASINSTSGTLYFEGASLESTLLSGYNYYITISDGTSSNRLELRQTTSNMQFLWRVNGVYQNQIVSSGILLTDFNKIALKYSNSQIALWMNGSQIGTINSPTLFPINTLNDLSFNDGTLGFPFRGKTKAVAVWKEALSDQELAELTTI